MVLAGELLREAEKLVQQRIHPMTIIDGKLFAGFKENLIHEFDLYQDGDWRRK